MMNYCDPQKFYIFSNILAIISKNLVFDVCKNKIIKTVRKPAQFPQCFCISIVM